MDGASQRMERPEERREEERKEKNKMMMCVCFANRDTKVRSGNLAQKAGHLMEKVLRTRGMSDANRGCTMSRERQQRKRGIRGRT